MHPTARFGTQREQHGDHTVAPLLATLGALSLGSYVTIQALAPRGSPFAQNPRAHLIELLPLWSAVANLPLPKSDGAILPLLLAALAAASVCYILAHHVAVRAGSDTASVAIAAFCAAGFSIASVLALPNFSSDIYAYIAYARVASVYHANPYVVSPAAFADDPVAPFVIPGAFHMTTPYGPVWTYLSVALSFILGSEDVVRSLIVMRALLFCFSLANLWLIWLILGRLNPHYRLAAVVCYGWNPIVVLKGIGHTEPVMLFFLLLSVHLHLRANEWGTLTSMVLSAVTKFATAPLLVVYFWHIWQRGSLRAFALGTMAAAGLTAIIFLPVWSGWDAFLHLARDPVNETTASLFTARRLVATPGLVATMVWAAYQAGRSSHDLLKGYTLVLLWFSLFFVPVNYAWYAIPLIGATSLIVGTRIAQLSLVFTLSALAVNVLAEMTEAHLSLPRLAFQLIWWGPLAAAAVWIFWRQAWTWGQPAMSRAQQVSDTAGTATKTEV